jgi:hypothetical protein
MGVPFAATHTQPERAQPVIAGQEGSLVLADAARLTGSPRGFGAVRGAAELDGVGASAASLA